MRPSGEAGREQAADHSEGPESKEAVSRKRGPEADKNGVMMENCEFCGERDRNDFLKWFGADRRERRKNGWEMAARDPVVIWSAPWREKTILMV